MGLAPYRFVSLASALLALIGASTPHPAWAAPCGDAPTLYARLMLTREQEFTDPRTTDFIRLYKNDPGFHQWMNAHGEGARTPSEAMERYRQARTHGDFVPKPAAARTVSLSNAAELNQPHAGLCRLCTWIDPGVTPREYTARVLSLQAGDTVAFGDATFKLGRFLGRGNTSHVWEIEGEPNWVLRIPFYSGPPKRGENVRPARDTRDFAVYGANLARALLEHYVQRAAYFGDLNIPRVAIRSRQGVGDDYAWAVVTRVRGTQDGKSFLRKMDPRQASDRALRERLYQRVNAFLAHSPPAHIRGEVSDADIQITARQFIREGDDWIMVDWD